MILFNVRQLTDVHLPSILFSRRTVLASFLVLFILNSIQLNAAGNYKPKIDDPMLESWRWQNFPKMNGKGFQCMFEAGDGALWFGVNEGVIRYDGLHWRFFSAKDGLPSDNVLTLCQGRDGKIYAGTESGLYVFSDNKWKRLFPHLMNRKIKVYQVGVFDDGNIWAATERGVFRIKSGEMLLYTSKSMASEVIEIDPEIDIVLVPDHVAKAFDIAAIYQDRQGTIWLGKYQGQMVAWNMHSSSPMQPAAWKIYTQKDGLQCGDVPRIIQTKDGQLWSICDQPDKGINVYNPKTKKWHSFRLSQIFGGDDSNWSIMQTRDGTIWIGGHSRVFVFQNNQWRVYRYTDVPLPSARIVMFEASDGALWLAGRNSEVYRIDYQDNHWKTYRGLHFQCESKNGTRWFINREGNVVSCQPETGKWTQYSTRDGLIDMPVALMVTANDVIWAAGSHRYKAATAYFDGHKWIMQRHPELSWGIDFRSAFQATDGSLWFGASPSTYIGNYLGGILKCKITENGDQHWSHYSEDSIGKFNVVGLAQTDDGFLWSGGSFVSRFNGNTWSRVLYPNELTSEWIDDVIATPSGDLWFAKGGVGLIQLKPGRQEWRKYTTEDGLASNMVPALLSLSDSTLLAATSKGINRFDGKTWNTLALPSAFYLKREGGTLCQSRDGAIWINIASRSWYRRAFNASDITDESFRNFRTIRYRPDNHPPETRIVQSQERVPKEGNTFIIWEGVDYLQETPESALQYSYRLDDSKWTPFAAETQKIFFSLNHGHHTFEVHARDQDFNVDPTPAKLDFYVLPPLWKQGWFISLILTFLSIIGFLLSYLYKKHLKIQRMEAEKVHEMDKMKLRFYANISHELRTPLSLIIGPLDELLANRRRIDKQTLKNRYELMRRNAKRLLHLVNEVIDFRKIETGRLRLSVSEGDIIEFIKNIIDSFNLLAQQHHITIEFSAGTDELYVLFDANKLDKILYNLLSNAFKFTPDHGKVTVSVMLKSENDKDIVEIVVEDTGPGISSKNLSRIFDRYYQGDAIGFRKREGVGIGLALTKELVDLYHGEIFANNKKNGGAIFTVRLPLELTRKSQERKDNDVTADSAGEIEQDENEKNKPLILIIDDSEDEREYIRDELSLVYSILEAKNGKEGLEKAVKAMPDLIVSDIMMPVLDGIELCKKIRRNKITSHIPLILLTARNSEEYQLKGLKTGADDYVTKPFNIRTLRARIQNLLESRKKLRKRFSREIKIQPKDITITPIDEKFLQHAIEIVEEHISDEKFDVGMFCEKVGMSRSQLFRKLKALTSQTPLEFIRTIRLKRAAQLLEKSQFTVTEICYQVGFNYPSHFTQHFHAQFGVAPKEYRKRL